ncbi:MULTISPECIES: DUF1127 domain-containing protein [Lonsdalea]|uniref:Uncharacterized protein n=2 Tax=Lonsdalea TaxID=1082702 RepID=A0ACD1JCR1_9GAMM|nr:MULTISPECIES: DUF1127 domain-containing protein [Lonsdalea]OSM94047.1 hypothetical protein AU508_15450 [Lonsdalea populi]OSM95561.1 hypothetical protein AU499_15230 [Lonsdalea populi]QPQ24046.1 DUF1127 domain-containing protein [Lonsdalea populi]RAT12142.1 hypothetical protein AU485_12470 [Lonsdalea quercina]RAT14133.1 hypothetical protein AU486_13345 [Lonsdalea quercina]
MARHGQHSQTFSLRALFIEVCGHWQRRRLRTRTRKLLHMMSDERLKDIGLSRADIDQCYRADAFGKDGWLQCRNDAHRKNER